MNDYKFRFVTRTRYTDYRVYINGGRDTISNREGFRPLRQKCSITEGEQCACVFAENAKIYLVVSALDRHKTDERGRAIRFSFCQIFTDKKKAASAFLKAAEHWEDVEKWLSRNLHDINEGSDTEGVELDESAFMKWLIADGEDFDSDDWLERGKVLKWTKRDGKEDYIPIGEVFDLVNADYADDSSGSKKKIVMAGAATAAVIAGLVIGGCYILGNKEKVNDIKDAFESKRGNAEIKRISEDIKTALPERTFTSRDSRDLEDVIQKSLDAVMNSGNKNTSPDMPHD